MIKDCKHGHKGKCCCNCKHQVKIYKHPLNHTIGKGPMSEIMGYGCTMFFNNIVFSESKHGICEEHIKIELPSK